MKRMKILLALCTVLMVVASISAASAAIVVDGVKSAGEWNEDWAFEQNKNAGHPYDINNLGDRMEVLQDGSYLIVDPMNDAGSSNNENMAQIGPDPSGYDINMMYAHYDPATDTLYGLATVYGIPGDLEGNGDPVDEGGIVPPATGGPAGIGIGPDEFFDIDITQTGVNNIGVRIQDDDWQDVDTVAYGDVNAAFTSGPNGVYEIAISDFSTYFDLSICAEEIFVIVEAGAINDNIPGQGSPGEDQVTIEINIPCPEIDIEKYVMDKGGVWQDADFVGVNLTDVDPVEFRYVVTNIGDEPLVNVQVTDDQIGPITCPQDTLEIGESMECFASDDSRCNGEPIVYTNVGDVIGIGTVTGTEVTDDDPAKYFCTPPEDVPAMTPVGLVGLIGMIGMIGIVALRRRD